MLYLIFILILLLCLSFYTSWIWYRTSKHLADGITARFTKRLEEIESLDKLIKNALTISDNRFAYIERVLSDALEGKERKVK